MTDYPDGYQRSLPGHTVELEASYAVPFHESTTLVINAAANSVFTLTFSDANWIYFIDTVNICPLAVVEFGSKLSLGAGASLSKASIGFIEFDIRKNPAIFFINGDIFSCTVYNYDVSAHTFEIDVNGTKIKRPASFGRSPVAGFTVVPGFMVTGESAQFTNISTGSPNTFLYEFLDPDGESTLQNPVHQFNVAGEYQPILTVSNAYGEDTWEYTGIIEVTDKLDLSGYTEVDPNGVLSVSGSRVTGTNVRRDSAAYVYYDFGASYFSDIDICCDFLVSATVSSAAVAILGLAGGVGTLYALSGVKLLAQVAHYSTTQFRLYFYCYSGTTVRASGNVILSKNTVYRLRLERAAGSTTATLRIYRGTYFDTLVNTITISHADVATLFRYFYPISSFSGATSPTASLYVDKIGIIDH